MKTRKPRHRSIKRKEFLQTIMFFVFTAVTILGLIAYLWVYSEVDETLFAIEVQVSTMQELQSENEELASKIEYLQRADVVARKASIDLGMTPAVPESLTVYIPSSVYSSLYD